MRDIKPKPAVDAVPSSELPPLRFCEPPASGARRLGLAKGPESSKKWLAVADVLINQHPGEWAFIGRHSTSMAYAIRVGALAAFTPAGAFDAVARQTGRDNRAGIWVRYVGGAA